MSLLGVVADSPVQQVWIAVHSVALQRRAHNPQATRMRRLSAVARKLRLMSQTLVGRRTTPNGILGVHTDSGFSKETNHNGYSNRDPNLFRVGVNPMGRGSCASDQARVPAPPIGHAIDVCGGADGCSHRVRRRVANRGDVTRIL